MFKLTDAQYAFALSQSGDIYDKFSQEEYFEKCRLQASTILPHVLPNQTIVEIGSGLGGTALALHQLLNDYNLKFILVDGDIETVDPTKKCTGLHNSSKETINFIKANSDSMSAVYKTPQKFIKSKRKFDIAYSYAAYPFKVDVSEYIQALKNNLNPLGKVLFEFRTDSNQLEELLEHFYPLSVYERTNKKSMFIGEVKQ